MNINLDSLSMTEIIRLQNLLSQELIRRFEMPAAIAFSDIVGSSRYFERFGDAYGRQLQQSHFDLLQSVVIANHGRIVDTAGDGAMSFFTSANDAATAMTALQIALSKQNSQRERDHQLILRIGLHWGRVLTDGVLVSGDVVNICARIAESAQPGEIRLSRELHQELDSTQRLQCHSVGNLDLQGTDRSLALLALNWLDHSRYPKMVRIRETEELIMLPLQDIVSFGRMNIIDGLTANDVVLNLPDPIATRKISRWHFELRRRPDGYYLRTLSNHPTCIDGQPVQHGEEVPLLTSSVVCISGVMTLEFLPHVTLTRHDDKTIYF